MHKTYPSISYHGCFLIPLNRLLYSVLPPSVANELRHKRPVPAKRYDNVTILFSGIVGFNAFCSKHASGEGAMKIVNLLNDLYTRFDTLTDSRKNPFVYKASPDHIAMQCCSDHPCRGTEVTSLTAAVVHSKPPCSQCSSSEIITSCYKPLSLL